MGTPGSGYPGAKTAALAALLEAHRIPYAVGGAIALFYWGEPRGTVDIDINIFLPQKEVDRVLDALPELGLTTSLESERRAILSTGQTRIDFDGTLVDLFFSNVDFHDSSAKRVKRVPFEGGEINVLSAEDIVVYKAMFNRRKDWADIEQVLYMQAGRFDIAYARDWIARMAGDADARVAEFDKLAREVAGWGEAPK